VLILVPLLQREIPMEPFFWWLLRNVLPFIGVAFIAIGGSRVLTRYLAAEGSWSYFAALAVGAIGYGMAAFLFLDETLLDRLKGWRRGHAALHKVPTA
jgi:hypothetical protein